MPEKKYNKPERKDFSGKRGEGKGFERKPKARNYNSSDKDELAPPRFLKRDGSDARPSSGDKKRFDNRKNDRPGSGKPFDKKPGRRPAGDKPFKASGFNDKPGFKDKPEFRDKPAFRDKPGFKGKPGFKSRENGPNEEDGKVRKPFRPKYDPEVKIKKSYRDAPPPKPAKLTFSERKKALTGETDDKDVIRLNKYVANSGICSRREADELIAKGHVAVNGKVIKEMGHKVQKTDTVTFDGKKIIPEPYVYILMNKPKDFLTTTEDDKGRKTVMDLVADKIPQRIFPVGRLDRNTTGVLLLTNDGDVTQALTHPSFEIKKVYQAELDKKATHADLDKLVNGIELEDGPIHADGVAFVDSDDKRQIGIEIHSGRNRIVRRMFEHLGYEVEKLDRVSFGIFTKKDLPRGKWRFLTQSEVSFLMKLKNDMAKKA